MLRALSQNSGLLFPVEIFTCEVVIHSCAAIFNTIKKWSKKNKLRIPCYQLMSTIVCYGSISILADRGSDLLSMLIAGIKVFSSHNSLSLVSLRDIKDSKTRGSFLEAISSYIHGFELERLSDRQITKLYIDQVDKLLPALLPPQKKR
jgi:hypothetical protein